MTNGQNRDNFEKGRVGEDIVCLGFRMKGYEIHRVGIEHTEFIHGYGVNDDITKDPLFTQIRKMPDFLITKDGKYHFLEVKFRSDEESYKSEEFANHISSKYLGKELDLGKGCEPDCYRFARRSGQQYCSLFWNVYILLLTPNRARIAKLSDFIRYESLDNNNKKSSSMESDKNRKYAMRLKWKNAWDKDNTLKEDIQWIQDNYYSHLCKETLPLWMAKFTHHANR